VAEGSSGDEGGIVSGDSPPAGQDEVGPGDSPAGAQDEEAGGLDAAARVKERLAHTLSGLEAQAEQLKTKASGSLPHAAHEAADRAEGTFTQARAAAQERKAGVGAVIATVLVVLVVGVLIWKRRAYIVRSYPTRR
jgi:hypothetical protein